jgi:hypothetical protein
MPALPPEAPFSVPVPANLSRPGSATPGYRRLDGTILRRIDRVFGAFLPAGRSIATADPGGLNLDFACDDWGPGSIPAKKPERDADTFAFLTVGLL